MTRPTLGRTWGRSRVGAPRHRPPARFAPPWLRRLARGLVGDAAADDLVQDTWIAALRHPPDGESRGRRETESLADASSAAPASPEDVVARAQLPHRLVELTLGMPEPHRTSLLLRYCEGLEPGEIARRAGAPARAWRR